MAIKFAANDVFRGEVEKFMKKNPYERLNTESLEQLQDILSELKSLAVEDRVNNTSEQIISPHTDLIITTEFLERSMDPPRTAELFLEIHKALNDISFVPAEIYRTMGKALNELNITEVNPDLEILIEEAKTRHRIHSRAGILRWDDRVRFSLEFKPSTVLEEHKKRGKERF